MSKPVKILEWVHTPERALAGYKSSATFRIIRRAEGRYLDVERKGTDALGEATWTRIEYGHEGINEVVVEGLIAEIVRLRAEIEVAKVNASPRAEGGGWDGVWPGPGPLP